MTESSGKKKFIISLCSAVIPQFTSYFCLPSGQIVMTGTAAEVEPPHLGDKRGLLSDDSRHEQGETVTSERRTILQVSDCASV